MSTYGRVSSNDLVLLHRVCMSRIRHLLGLVDLLSGMYQTSETYDQLRTARVILKEAQAILEQVCPYDSPLKAEGVF